MGGSIHIHGTGSSIVDTVFVCRDRGHHVARMLFETRSSLPQIDRELDELSAAGMKPTAGDIRCIAFGHLTRMAIWRLRAEWDAARSTAAKLESIRLAMDALATVDEVRAALEGAKPLTATGVVAQNKKNREQANAVAF